MYIYINSLQSLDINTNNTAGKFTVQLPKTFSSKSNTTSASRGRWFLGLVEITLPPIDSSAQKWDLLYIMCPHVEGVAVGSSYKPLLRAIPQGEIRRHNYARFDSVLHVPLRVADLANISIEVRNSSGELRPELATETKHSSSCILELIWKGDINH